MSPVSPRPKARDLHQSNGLQRLPWDEALLLQIKGFEGRERELIAKIAELKAENTKLRQALYLSRQRLENWKLRQQAWGHERRELLEKIKGFM